MKIYIIRHGETDLNAGGILQGWLDEPLNQNGRDLAVMTGQAMKGIHFDRCISSPLKRARETAEIILRESGNDIPIFTDDRLREMNFGDMEGRKLCEAEEETDMFLLRFFGFKNGESIEAVCRRTQAFLRELAAKDDGKTWLISTHGCALRAMLNFLYPNPSDFWRGHVPYHCSVSIVEVKDGKLILTEEDKVYLRKKAKEKHR